MENPDGRYKFASAEINLSQDVLKVSRQTYSFLEWLGDVGGLMDALIVLIYVLIIPY